MVQQKHFPAYLPEHKIPAKSRASLMLTYEQILAVASAMLVIMEQSEKLFKRLHLTAAEKQNFNAIHNACINCCLSLEEYERGKDHAEK